MYFQKVSLTAQNMLYISVFFFFYKVVIRQGHKNTKESKRFIYKALVNKDENHIPVLQILV
jgi:hypothetical protein